MFGHLCKATIKKIKNENELTMKTIFYTVSVLMVVAWAVSYFVYALNTTIHFLLLTAALLGLAGLMEKR